MKEGFLKSAQLQWDERWYFTKRSVSNSAWCSVRNSVRVLVGSTSSGELVYLSLCPSEQVKL